MDYLDKIKQAALTVAKKGGELAKYAGEKASDTIEVTKLNTAIRAERSKIAQAQADIGKLVWDAFCEGEQFSEEVNALCESIKEAAAVIVLKEQEIETLKAPSEEEEQEGCGCDEQCTCNPACVQCGEPLNYDARFCTSCGAKVELMETSPESCACASEKAPEASCCGDEPCECSDEACECSDEQKPE